MSTLVKKNKLVKTVEYTLTLSENEAVALHTVLLNVEGDVQNTANKYIEEIREKFSKTWSVSEDGEDVITGVLTFTENSLKYFEDLLKQGNSI